MAAAAPAGAQAPPPIVGYAYDRVTGAPLYSEHHAQTFRDGRLATHRVEYRGVDGVPFCEKELRYGEPPFAPSFRLDDRRNGYREGGEAREGTYHMFRVAGGRRDTSSVAAAPDLVADAGFDVFVRARLAELLQAPQRVTLAVPGQLTTLGLSIRTIAADAEQVTLRATPGVLLRLFVAPIELLYDRRTGRLLRYVGISNIRSPSGDLYDARIDFPAGGERPRDFTAP